MLYVHQTSGWSYIRYIDGWDVSATPHSQQEWKWNMSRAIFDATTAIKECGCAKECDDMIAYDCGYRRIIVRCTWWSANYSSRYAIKFSFVLPFFASAIVPRLLCMYIWDVYVCAAMLRACVTAFRWCWDWIWTTWTMNFIQSSKAIIAAYERRPSCGKLQSNHDVSHARQICCDACNMPLLDQAEVPNGQKIALNFRQFDLIAQQEIKSIRLNLSK